ncbi:DNA mismatch repair protein MutS [Peptoniphilus lacrimalis]|uniref:DNA mismatch repair protein MutS n=1 Tax=Peptoniphilus lacrimalis 315-B TaxID=596330 RepID=D1VS85_9FIRM|nr:DNA mismatch repair protein MutS [Peptoniphilus lacrimalis]EFA90578.1 DNA mismatch repair protein MutS [Peptoniphilus lacrimalis 315-B]
MNNNKPTPMMLQYLDTKKKHPDSILFFRLGDFYEMFFDDAILASKELEIALTKRDAGFAQKAPMCGIPYHVAHTYISKLINKGYKVTICDQVEDPKLAKGLVKRQVTKIITPGTFTDSDFLKSDENNYLMAVYLKKYDMYIAYTDFSTGELYYTYRTFLDEESLFSSVRDEIYRIMPSEILVNEDIDKTLNKFLSNNFFITNYKNDDIVNIDIGKLVCENLTDLGQKNFNEKKLSDNIAIKTLLDYLFKTQKIHLNHINNFNHYDYYKNLVLDENSKRTLELLKGLNTNNKKGSLLEILDKCKTSMGSRLLKKWLSSPLTNIDRIEDRLNHIEDFNSDLLVTEDIKDRLKNIYDIERLSLKISNKTLNPKEINSIKETINLSLEIKKLLGKNNNNLKNLSVKIENLVFISEKIDQIIIDDPPAIIEDERVIKKGYSLELDELFSAKEEGKDWILNFEKKEKEKTGIKNLRIKYNKILGYFIEVTKSNISQIPSDYIRKQTLVGSERYFSVELKEMESKLLVSKDEALRLQSKILSELKNFLLENIIKFQNLSKIISAIDVLVSLSEVSRRNNYKRPLLNKEGLIDIKKGRHPIVEKNYKDELFVPNDTYLDLDKNLIHIITGPNMAGKSTYMRQVALITIMAHIGSFVPCEYANISVLDRIFTRIGASDNLAMGQSTFMVEMKEVANIIDNASKNSLLILDEVGRGTSTYDGLSIAYAILEYIATNLKAKTLFATHYHELCSLEEKYPSISNLSIAVKKEEEDIIFLRKIINGPSNHSYGIDVAKLAGIDDFIIKRAWDILNSLENNKGKNKLNKNFKIDNFEQKSIFDIKKDKFIEKVKNIDINNLSPMDAFKMLNEIIEKSKEI